MALWNHKVLPEVRDIGPAAAGPSPWLPRIDPSSDKSGAEVQTGTVEVKVVAEGHCCEVHLRERRDVAVRTHRASHPTDAKTACSLCLVTFPKRQTATLTRHNGQGSSTSQPMETKTEKKRQRQFGLDLRSSDILKNLCFPTVWCSFFPDVYWCSNFTHCWCRFHSRGYVFV